MPRFDWHFVDQDLRTAPNALSTKCLEVGALSIVSIIELLEAASPGPAIGVSCGPEHIRGAWIQVQRRWAGSRPPRKGRPGVPQAQLIPYAPASDRNHVRDGAR